MRTVQRERRYVCGLSKQGATYQEVEIYTVTPDKKGRDRDKEARTPPEFRGNKPKSLFST